jgi:hypothetical protein
MPGAGIRRGKGALAPHDSVRRGAATLAWFAATMLLGAFLVFSIQPIFARMTLPMLGGAPAVWNTAMVFFQCALLAGYAYAHCLSRSFGLRGQIAGHLSLLAVASLSLRHAADARRSPSDHQQPPRAACCGARNVDPGQPGKAALGVRPPRPAPGGRSAPARTDAHGSARSPAAFPGAFG